MQDEAAIMERFGVRDRVELYALPARLVEQMQMVIDADHKAQQAAGRKT